MSRNMPGVSNSANYGDSGARTALDNLRKRIGEITFIKIAAGGNVYDANRMFFRMIEHPFKSTLNLIFADAPGATDFNEHEICVGRYAAIKTFTRSAVTRCDYRSHHAMPTR